MSAEPRSSAGLQVNPEQMTLQAWCWPTCWRTSSVTGASTHGCSEGGPAHAQHCSACGSEVLVAAAQCSRNCVFVLARQCTPQLGRHASVAACCCHLLASDLLEGLVSKGSSYPEPTSSPFSRHPHSTQNMTRVIAAADFGGGQLPPTFAVGCQGFGCPRSITLPLHPPWPS